MVNRQDFEQEVARAAEARGSSLQALEKWIEETAERLTERGSWVALAHRTHIRVESGPAS